VLDIPDLPLVSLRAFGAERLVPSPLGIIDPPAKISQIIYFVNDKSF
jgi:hypothetical protein